MSTGIDFRRQNLTSVDTNVGLTAYALVCFVHNKIVGLMTNAKFANDSARDSALSVLRHKR